MDLTESIAPKTDQQNFDDYLVGPRTVTISGVSRGSSEQPVNVELTEYPGKPYKPNKSMRRVLVAAWGTDSSAYVGRRLTLVGNPNVSYGGKKVGGIEIAAMSNLGKPLTLALTETRGKKRTFTVQPLPDAPTPTPNEIPADVLATIEQAKADGKLPAYLQHAIEKEFPAHAIDYIKTRIKEQQ